MAAAGSDSESDYGWDLSFEEDVNQLLSAAAAGPTNNTAAPTAPIEVSLRDKSPLQGPPDDSLRHEAGSKSCGANPAVVGPAVQAVGDSQTRDNHETMGDVSYPDLSRVVVDFFSGPSGADKGPKKTAGGNKNNNTKNTSLSPLARFRTFPRKPLSVSDLTSGAWCELQYEYTLTRLPGGKRTRTPAMKAGTKVHARLEEEVHTTVQVDVISREDAYGLKLWNVITGLRTLRETGLTRELEVWGVVGGQVVTGIIDALSYHNPDPELEAKTQSSKAVVASKNASPSTAKITDFFGSQSLSQAHQPGRPGQPDQPDQPDQSGQPERKIYITDIKTRGSNKLPTGAAVRPAKIQLFLYHRFLSDLATGHLDFQILFGRYGLDAEAPFSDAFIAQIGSLHEEIFYDDAADAELPTSTEASAADASGTEEHASQTSQMTHQTGGTSQSGQTGQETNAIRYRNLRSLAEHLQREAKLTFPNGASSLGGLVSVEYRLRPQKTLPRRSKRRGTAAVSNSDSGNSAGASSGDSDYMDVNGDEDAGRCIGTNVIPVDSAILDRYLEKYLAWWRGERAATGVDIEEASLKCGYCEFVADCNWRQALDDERVRRVRERLAAGGPTG